MVTPWSPARSSPSATPQHTGLLRLNADGTGDPAFAHGTFGRNVGMVESITRLADGRILAAGMFDGWNGAPAAGLVRLQANGTIDGSFQGREADLVTSVAIQPDQKIVYSVPRRVVRLNADGAADRTFQSGPADLWVRSVAVQTDGMVLAAGDFSTFAGEPHSGVVRLTGVAPQEPAPVVQAPGTPRALSLTAKPKKVVARWTGLEGSDSYQVRVTGRTAKGRAVSRVSTVPRSKATISVNLRRKSTVTVCITASNAGGTSPQVCRSKKVR